jgi:hypothetical protein
MADQRTPEVITPEFRGSFVHLFQVEKKPDGSDGMYSINALFPKKSADWKADLPWLFENLKAALLIKWPGFQGMPPSFANKLVGKPWPVSDGDAPNSMGNVQESHKGHWVVRMASKNFNASKNLLNGQTGEEGLMTEANCYSGCYFKASVNSYVFVRTDGCGVNVGLNNIMFTREGEPLGGSSQSAAAAFGVKPTASAASAAFSPAPKAAPSSDPFAVPQGAAPQQDVNPFAVPPGSVTQAAPAADWLS